jgi:hypothetical protein
MQTAQIEELALAEEPPFGSRLVAILKKRRFEGHLSRGYSMTRLERLDGAGRDGVLEALHSTDFDVVHAAKNGTAEDLADALMRFARTRELQTFTLVALALTVTVLGSRLIVFLAS